MACPKVLLVEGSDDLHVFECLMKHHKAPKCFEIRNKEGIDQLLQTLPVERKASDLEALGVVVDADSDIDARWQSVRNILIDDGYNVPEAPDPEGTIVCQPNEPVVGVWLMPNNRLPGMLEDFVAFLVPPDNALWRQAQDAVGKLPATAERFPEAHRSKACVHTWLAWQREPGSPMGQAITKRYLDAEVDDVHCLLRWLDSLFNFRGAVTLSQQGCPAQGARDL